MRLVRDQQPCTILRATPVLPNLIIIGAMKAGTTSLHEYLSRHPGIFMSKQKELNFFVAGEGWDKGLDWYEAQFPSESFVRGESSPNYTKYPRFGGVPERMKAILPDAKLIYLVRDPIERIISHYIDAYSWNREPRTISEVASDHSYKNYVACSQYAMQLEQYLPHYDKSRVLVVATEELKEDRRAVLRTIFRFLEVDEDFWTPEFDAEHWRADQRQRKTRLGYALVDTVEIIRNSRLRPVIPKALARPVRALAAAGAAPIGRPMLDGDVREELIEFLRPDIERLRDLTGQTFDRWAAV